MKRQQQQQMQQTTTTGESGQHQQLVGTATGDHICPMAVSFAGKVQNIGENANVKASSAGSIGISHLNWLLFRSDPDYLSDSSDNGSTSDSDKLQQFYRFDFQKPTNSNNDVAMLSIDDNGQQQSFSANAVLSMLLSKVKDSTGATMDRLQSNTSNDTTRKLQLTSQQKQMMKQQKHLLLLQSLQFCVRNTVTSWAQVVWMYRPLLS
jgi:subtilase family serine protease